MTLQLYSNVNPPFGDYSTNVLVTGDLFTREVFNLERSTIILPGWNYQIADYTSERILMDFIKKLNKLLSASSEKDGDALWVYVRCAGCGEKLRTRINLINDLSIDFGEGENQDIYICRKTLVGNQQCFRRIEIELTFNSNRKINGREIVGGEFISVEEFDAS